MIRKVFLAIALIATFTVIAPADAGILLTIDPVPSTPYLIFNYDQNPRGAFTASGDQVFLTFTNVSGTNFASLEFTGSGIGPNGNWNFDQALFVSGAAVNILTPDGVNNGSRGPLSISFTSGLANGQSVTILAEPDNPLANQLLSLDSIMGQSTITVLQSDNQIATGTFNAGLAGTMNVNAVAAVPEPSSFAMLGLVAVGGVFHRWRRGKKFQKQLATS
jgi:PEP-CTERM motif